ncbi:hypothetical protein K438DRAFT_1857552 [Mycena galopus ATCC 62051]|nr:hypothetical protein K438DRAFT_1857552 [Mycena galopus ATCC 62051]
MSILDLSLELLQEITDRIPAHHGQLRVVCWSLNYAVAPSFFSSVLLDVHSSRLEIGISHLEALATGTTGWSEFARNLTIKRLSPSLVVDPNEDHVNDEYQLELAEARLEHVLRPALESLKGVRTVLWQFSRWTEETRWTPETIHDFMGSLPQLDFRLTTDQSGFERNFDCSFERLANLQKLTVRSSDGMSLAGVCRSLHNAVRNSPGLSFLHLETDDVHLGIPPLDSFADLFPRLAQPLLLTELHMLRYHPRLDHGTIPHLRSLKSVWLFNGNPRIWDSLRQECIHLTEIRTDTIGEDLLQYLSSYSGLERLTITCAGEESEEEANRCADEFFTDVLPHHTQSLVALSCHGQWERRWSFGMHNAGVLAQLQNLTSLRMNVNSILVEDAAAHETESHGIGRAPNRIIKIASDSDGRNMVHHFLDLINRLPITDAAIMPSIPELYRDFDRYPAYRKIFIGEIDEAVRAFRSRDSRVSAAVVLAGYNYYQMEGGEGRYCAVESAKISCSYAHWQK